MNNKKIVYVDMDGVIADFDGGMYKLAPDLYLGEGSDYEVRSKMVDSVCEKNSDIFHNLDPLPGGIEGVKELMKHYDVYFLSTPMYNVPDSYTGKRIWLEKHFGELAAKRLMLSHRKDLHLGDYLIDDRTRNGAGEFTGEHIHFATDKFPDWKSILTYLIPNEKKGVRAILQYYKNEPEFVECRVEIPKYNVKDNKWNDLQIYFDNLTYADFYSMYDGIILLSISYFEENHTLISEYIVKGKINQVEFNESQFYDNNLEIINGATVKPLHVTLLSKN